MSAAEATPRANLPWFAGPDKEPQTGHVYDRDGAMVATTWWEGNPNADAALIVRAVNAHDDLVKALRSMVDMVESVGPMMRVGGPAAHRAALSALLMATLTAMQSAPATEQASALLVALDEKP